MDLLTASAGVGEAQEGRGARRKPEQSPVTQPAYTECFQLGQGSGHFCSRTLSPGCCCPPQAVRVS